MNDRLVTTVPLATTINAEHALAQQCAGTAVEHAVRCGQLLLEVKSGLNHGEFLPWIEANCEFSGQSARVYMAAAKQNARGLAISSLAKLLGSSHNHRAQGTGENEWYTPVEHVERVRVFLGGIDLDPASSAKAQEVIKATRFFSIDDDGLKRAWKGRVFLNPPYAQPAIQQFAEKMIEEVDKGRVTEAVMLTHNYTDTEWFQIAYRSCAAICFTRGRIAFLDPDGNKAAPTQGQAFFYYGKRAKKFAEAFWTIGLVVAPLI